MRKSVFLYHELNAKKKKSQEPKTYFCDKLLKYFPENKFLSIGNINTPNTLELILRKTKKKKQ